MRDSTIVDREFVLSALGNRDALLNDVEQALAEHGSWRRFVEVRMGAGPTVEFERSSDLPSEVTAIVVWGSQRGEARLGSTKDALEAADRMATAFYEMRDSQTSRRCGALSSVT